MPQVHDERLADQVRTMCGLTCLMGPPADQAVEPLADVGRQVHFDTDVAGANALARAARAFRREQDELTWLTRQSRVAAVSDRGFGGIIRPLWQYV